MQETSTEKMKIKSSLKKWRMETGTLKNKKVRNWKKKKTEVKETKKQINLLHWSSKKRYGKNIFVSARWKCMLQMFFNLH